MSQRSFDRDAQRRRDAERRRDTLRRRRAGLAVGLAGAAALAAPAVAQADSFQVTTLADTHVDGQTTLREAIDAAEDSDEASTVTFASNVRGTITLDGRIFYTPNDSTNTLDIQGPGAGALAVSGDNDSGIFYFGGSGAPVSVSGLTLTQGYNSQGGAIEGKYTDITLTNTVVKDNVASGSGGGGIYLNGGSLDATGSNIDDNSLDAPVIKFKGSDTRGLGPIGVVGDGAGILAEGAAVSISSSTVDRNEAGEGAGGGIAAFSQNNNSSARAQTRGREPVPADVDITNSSVSGNTAAVGGGGKFNLPNDDVSITRSTFAGNTATGVEGTGVIQVPQPPIVNPNVDAKQTKLVQGGGIPGAGGGAFIAADSSTVLSSTFSGNQALEPEVPDTVNDRSSKGGFGGLFSSGGGLILVSRDGQVSNSTLANNGAAVGGGIVTLGEGLGNDDLDDRSSTRLLKTTRASLEAVEKGLKGDPTNGGDEGDGDEGNGPEFSSSIDNTTVSGNEAGLGGGGVVGIGDIEASSTIIAGNTAGEEAPDVAATEGSVDAEYSLIQDPGDALDSPATNITGQAAQLGGLANNGGPTKTLLPAETSPAIDRGTANDLANDQRGARRTSDRSPANATDGTDIGSVELPAPAVATPGTGRRVTPSSVPASCSRRTLSLTDARIKGGKVVLKGLVGTRFYGKKVTIQTDPEGAKASGYSKTATATAAKSDGTFTVSVPRPSKDDVPTVRYRAKIGKATSPALKLPQSLTLKSVKSKKGTITVTGRVDKDVLGKRNKVTIRRLACGRYRTVGKVKPDADGNYTLTFKSTRLRGVGLYRAESSVQVRPGSKKYVKQYARAISIKTTGQTG